MADYRGLSVDEIKALVTFNCCANAIKENVELVQKRLKKPGHEGCIDNLQKASELVADVVEHLITESDDEDEQALILKKMSRLKLQFGYVRKYPETMVMMNVDDAQTLLAPVLEKCDLECPCIEYGENGEPEVVKRLVKGCETRKALKRLGLAELGLSMECPYRMMVGK